MSIGEKMNVPNPAPELAIPEETQFIIVINGLCQLDQTSLKKMLHYISLIGTYLSNNIQRAVAVML